MPLYADRGPAGGYQLLDGYRTRLTGLTAGEAESLFLAGAPGPAAELGLGTVLAAAQLKLLAALPPELRARAGRVRERFHLDAPGWLRDADQPPHLGEVADAVWNQRAVRARYRRWGGEVERTLEPLGLILKGGVWYVAARVDGDARAYRVSRILDLETLDSRFERPADFDLADFWRVHSERFQATLHRAEATVRLAPHALDLLPAVLDPAAARPGRLDPGHAPDRIDRARPRRPAPVRRRRGGVGAAGTARADDQDGGGIGAALRRAVAEGMGRHPTLTAPSPRCADICSRLVAYPPWRHTIVTASSSSRHPVATGPGHTGASGAADRSPGEGGEPCGATTGRRESVGA